MRPWAWPLIIVCELIIFVPATWSAIQYEVKREVQRQAQEQRAVT